MQQRNLMQQNNNWWRFKYYKRSNTLSSFFFGLQPYKIFIIENPELRAQIKTVDGQAQVIDASHLLVFASKINIGDEEVDEYVKNTSITREASIESLDGYANFKP
jgi:nitroreductase